MNLTGHNLALLASLSAMLDEKNVTRAAARLGLSQPALSAQLSRLRDVFGDPLLTPALSGKGMVLTPRAAGLREPLRQALKALEDVVNIPHTFDPASSDRVFTIGVNDNAGTIMAPRLMQHVQRQRFRGMRFAFRMNNLARLPGQLESGEIDLALTSKNAVANASQELLLQEDFVVAQRKDHPRGARPLTIDEYVALEHVIVSGDGGGFRGFIDDALAELGVTRRVVASVQYYSLVPLLLQATDLVCTLPTRFVQRHVDILTAMTLPFDVRQFSVYSTWHYRFDNDPAHQWLRQQLSYCVTHWVD